MSLFIDGKIIAGSATFSGGNVTVLDGLIKIHDGTDQLVVNSDGSINVQSSAVGMASVDLIDIDVSSTNILTSGYTQILAATSADIEFLDITNTTGQFIYIATGAAASEVDEIIVPPNGVAVNLSVASGARLSAKALDANATVGRLTLTTLG